MKLIKVLVAVATLFFGVTANIDAQSVSPGFNDLTIQDGYGHVIRPLSNTHQFSIDDLGNEVGLIRRVGYQFAPPVEDMSLTQVVGLGIDSFDVHFPSMGNGWATWVEYRKLSDPNVVVFSKVTGGIATKEDPNPILTNPFSINGGLLSFDYQVGRYSLGSGPSYIAHLVFNIRNADLGDSLVYSDTVAIIPAGSVTINNTKTIALYTLDQGLLCVDLEVLYSHQGPGFNDFKWEKVGQSPIGLNCEYWQGGLSTDTSELGEGEKLPLVVYPNPTSGAVTLSGVNPDLPVLLYSGANGQLVRTFPPQSGGELLNLDLSELSAGFYILRQEDNRAVKLEKH